MPSFRPRLAGLPIRRKLQLITLILLPVVAVLTAATVPTIGILSGLRAYVAGESLYSKYQKNAVFYLARFIRDGEPADLRRFHDAIAVPLGDNNARRELDRETPDFDAARRHLLQGRNAPEDIPWMIRVYRWFRHAPYMRDAIEMWAAADPMIAELIAIGRTVAERHAEGGFPDAERDSLLHRVEELNASLIIVENRFTEMIGEGFRWAASTMLAALLVVDALILGAGLWMGNRIAGGIIRQVNELTHGASALAAGDRSTRVVAESDDELGRLAGWFNEMAGSVESAETELRGTLSILSSTLESTVDGILVLDLEGRVSAYNRKLLEIWQIDDSQIAHGMPIGELLFVSRKLRDPGAALGRFGGILADPEIETHDLLEFADGRIVERYSQPQRDGDRSVGRVFSFRDVTEKKRFEEDLLRSNRELEQFAYVASHDLQEPLRTVASYVRLLQRRYGGRLDSEADEFIQFAVDGSVRMQRLIRDLLEFSRVTTRGKALEPTDATAVLEGVIAQLQATIAAEHATVTFEPLPRVLADPTQLAQVFQNLIANAIKFRSESPPAIHVTGERMDGECVFRVSDNGIGIPPEYGERIFALFQRLHPVGMYDGTGIGLAICKKIVERHGGRIAIEPGNGPGSTFRFTLPAVPGEID